MCCSLSLFDGGLCSGSILVLVFIIHYFELMAVAELTSILFLPTLRLVYSLTVIIIMYLR